MQNASSGEWNQRKFSLATIAALKHLAIEGIAGVSFPQDMTPGRIFMSVWGEERTGMSPAYELDIRSLASAMAAPEVLKNERDITARVTTEIMYSAYLFRKENDDESREGRKDR